MTELAPGWSAIPLAEHANNRGLTPAAARDQGGFNIWGNSFPAEELPPPGGITWVAGTPFRFPLTRAGHDQPGDNLRCRGQRVDVPAGRWDWIHVLGAAERRTEDPLLAEYRDGRRRPLWLRLSDFWPETEPRFGEVLAFRCRGMHYPRHRQHTMTPAIWAQRVPLPNPDQVVALLLPDNPALHLFALTLQDERRSQQ